MLHLIRVPAIGRLAALALALPVTAAPQHATGATPALAAIEAVAELPASAVTLPPPPPYGIVVMAHGGDAEWNEQIRAAVASIDTAVPLRIAFGMADRAALAAAVAELEAEGVRRIAVVRLFVSADSFRAQTEYLLGLDDRAPDLLFDSSRVGGMRPVPDAAAVPPIAHDSAIAVSTGGLVDDGLSGLILAERALALSRAPQRETVLVIAHGMGDEDENDELLATLRRRADAVRAAAPFRDVRVETLREDWPEHRAAAEQRIREIVRRGGEDGRVIVLPFRVAGFGPYAEVLDGLEYSADGVGLLPHPGLAAWILRSARTIACSEGWQSAECEAP